MKASEKLHRLVLSIVFDCRYTNSHIYSPPRSILIQIIDSMLCQNKSILLLLEQFSSVNPFGRSCQGVAGRSLVRFSVADWFLLSSYISTFIRWHWSCLNCKTMKCIRSAIRETPPSTASSSSSTQLWDMYKKLAGKVIGCWGGAIQYDLLREILTIRPVSLPREELFHGLLD